MNDNKYEINSFKNNEISELFKSDDDESKSVRFTNYTRTKD